VFTYSHLKCPDHPINHVDRQTRPVCVRINHPSRALYDIWVVSYPDQQGARYNDSAGSLREQKQTTTVSVRANRRHHS